MGKYVNYIQKSNDKGLLPTIQIPNGYRQDRSRSVITQSLGNYLYKINIPIC